MTGFLQAIADFNQAFQLISKLRLWIYLIIPAIISVVIGIAMVALVISFGAHFGSWLASIFPFDFGAEWVATAGQWLGYLVMAVLGIFIFKYIIIILLAPFLSPLSQKIELYLRPNETSASWTPTQVASEIVRSLRINLRNIFRELVFTILFLMLGFIPVIGLVSGALIIMIQSYYAGFGNMDFTLERHLNVKSSIAFIRDNRGLAIGNGLVFIFMLMIPIFGLLLAPPLAVIAATIGTVRKLPIH